MSTNHVGQYINPFTENIVHNLWLVAHGFPPHEDSSQVNPQYRPLIRQNSVFGSPIVQPNDVAWAPGWDLERFLIEFSNEYPGITPPEAGSQSQSQSVPPQPGVAPISLSQELNQTIHSFGSGLTGTIFQSIEKPMALKKAGKNKIYNVPLAQIRRMKHGQKKGEIGLEIECEGMNLVQGMVDYWLVHQDNSLRAVKDHPPQEYVLREPIPRKDVPKALKYLSNKLQSAGSELVYSHRTSVHVHLNCQQLSLKEIYQIWCMYTIFEEILVDFSGPDRPGNLFCLSSKQAQYQVFTLQNALMSENFEEVFNDNLRYTSCNVASLGKFGSLEFRSMRGTVDQGLIQTWVDILCIIKDKALEYKNPQEIVKDFQRLNSEGFLKKIFGEREDLLAIFQSYPGRHKQLWDGLRLMRDVAYAIEWEDRVVEDKDSPKKDEADLVAYNLEAVSYIPGIYKIHASEDDLEDIQSNINEDIENPEGMYWLVNYSIHPLIVSRLNPDGTPRAGTWSISSNRKALFNEIHQYCGHMTASLEEIEIGQQFA